jgi:glycosyltransferase 2 family protein
MAPPRPALTDTEPAVSAHPPRRADARNGQAAEPAPAAAAPELDERAVDLKARFFNLRTALSFLLGIAILVGVIRYADIHPEEVLAQLRQVDVRVYLLAALCYAMTFPFRGLRWRMLLGNVGVHAPVVTLTEVIFISWFVNSVLPGKIGDLYRGYALKREFGHSFSRMVGTVVAERVMDLLALILLLGVSGWFVLRSRVSPVVDNLIHLGWLGFAFLIVGMLCAYFLGERVVAFFPGRIQDAYARFAHGTFASLRARSWPGLATLTVLAWSAEAARLYFVMQALQVPALQANAGPLAALFTVAAVSLSLIIPTPGGLGGVEAAFVLVLAVFGVDKSLAVTVAFLDRLISYYSLIVFGFPAFLVTKRGR